MISPKAAIASGIPALGFGWYGLSILFMRVMPTYKTISKLPNFLSDYSDDTFGFTYGKYLVDPKWKTWWFWSFNEIFKRASKESLSTEFQAVKEIYKNVKEGTDSEDAHYLNRVCDSAFKKKQTDIDKISNPTSNDIKYWNNIWTFCSVTVGKPVTIDNSNEKETYLGTENRIGETEKENLVSTRDERNLFFWEAKTKIFFETGNVEFSDSKSSTSSDNLFFKKLYNDNKNKEEKERENLKDRCEEAYGLDPAPSISSETQPTKEEVKKFCTLYYIASRES